MYDDDFGFYMFFVGIGLMVLGLIMLIFMTSDADQWTGPVKNCYVHTHSYNHLSGPDTKTSDTYCKVDK